MKAKGTIVAAWFSWVCAVAFGMTVVAYVWIPTPKKDGSWLPCLIILGLISLAALGLSRLEDDPIQLDQSERELREKYEKQIAEIARRKKALT